jgi:hypothetical protein
MCPHVPGLVGRLLSADAGGADNGAGPLVVELNIGRQVFSCATSDPASSNTTHWYRFCFVLNACGLLLWSPQEPPICSNVTAANGRKLSCSAGLEA